MSFTLFRIRSSRICAKYLVAFLLASLLSHGGFAHAVYYVDGNQLLERVHSDKQQAARFYAYVSGMVDSLDGRGIAEIGCFRIPSEATLGQVADSVKVFLDQNPKVRHKNAAHLVVTALSADYPCK